MNDTIAYYNEHVAEFTSGTVNADMSATRDRFTAMLKPGSRILDAGCGTGRDAKAFLEQGFLVDAFDASKEMCRYAFEYTGISVRCMRFEELEGSDEYDGIWACASLLHVREKDLHAVLSSLYRLLKDGGVLYASFKYGTGEREKNRRLFLDMNEKTLSAVLKETGFEQTEIFVTGDVRPGRDSEQWINSLACKCTFTTEEEH